MALYIYWMWTCHCLPYKLVIDDGNEDDDIKCIVLMLWWVSSIVSFDKFWQQRTGIACCFTDLEVCMTSSYIFFITKAKKSSNINNCQQNSYVF